MGDKAKGGVKNIKKWVTSFTDGLNRNSSIWSKLYLFIFHGEFISFWWYKTWFPTVATYKWANNQIKKQYSVKSDPVWPPTNIRIILRISFSIIIGSSFKIFLHIWFLHLNNVSRHFENSRPHIIAFKMIVSITWNIYIMFIIFI